MVKLRKDGQEKQSGGKRVGSGRKPKGDKKIQCTFYTERCNLLLLGGKKKIRQMCVDLVNTEIEKRKKK